MELALVLPVLLIIVFGIVDFGRMYNAQITITEAAREGARVQALGGTYAGNPATTRVKTVFNDDQHWPQVTVAAVGCESTANGNATVTVTYRFSFLTPFAPRDLDLHASGVVACVP